MGDEALPVDGLKVIFGSGSTVDAKGLVTLPRALILHLENCPIFDRAAYPWPFPHPIDQAPIGDDGAVSLNIQQQIWCIRNSLGNAEIFLTEFQATLMSILELCLLDPRRISLDGKREVRLKRRLEETCQGFNQQMMIRSLSSAQLRERLGLLCHSAFAKAEAVILNLDMAQKSHKKILSHTKRGEVRSSYDAFLASFPDVKNVRDGISHEDERVEGRAGMGNKNCEMILSDRFENVLEIDGKLNVIRGLFNEVVFCSTSEGFSKVGLDMSIRPRMQETWAALVESIRWVAIPGWGSTFFEEATR